MWCKSLHIVVIKIIIVLALVSNVAYGQKRAHFIGNRTTMVHLFEWTWPAIARECEEFLGPRGFGGVQVSPVHEARVIPGRPWWERYQLISYKLNSRSGNEDELRDMIERCNRAGVRIYVDVVLNHMSGYDTGESIGTAGSRANYAERSYPAVIYVAEHFNPSCDIKDYNSVHEVRNCQLNTLLDLNQTHTHVRQVLSYYMNKLIDMGVAGFHIDAAKHMWPHDLEAIYNNLHNLNKEFHFPPNTRPFIYHDIIDFGSEAITKQEYTHLGIITEFKHATELGRSFGGRNNLKWLRNWGPQWSLLQSIDALVFIDNHDNQHGQITGYNDILTYKNGEVYKLALIFMLAHPYGNVPRLMSSFINNSSDQSPPVVAGTEQISVPSYLTTGECDTATSGWVCEHRWSAVANMVEFRNIVDDSCVDNWWDNGYNQIAFARGRHGFVAFNLEADNEMSVILQTNLKAGNYCDIISGGLTNAAVCTGRMFTVTSDGIMKINLPKGPTAMAVHIDSRIPDKK